MKPVKFAMKQGKALCMCAGVMGLVACGAPDDSDALRIGGVASAIVTAPVDGCLRLDAASPLRNRSEQFRVTANVEQEVIMDALPLTAITLSGSLFPTPDCSGAPLFFASPVELELSPDNPFAKAVLEFLGNGRVEVDSVFEGNVPIVCAAERNVAVDASLSSDGWAGGTSKADLCDGETSYASWARGLAHPGGQSNWNGEPCGPYQVTLQLETSMIHKAMFWHHGFEHIPPESDFIEVSQDGNTWEVIDDQRTLRPELEDCSAGYCSVPTEHTFQPIEAAWLRYSIDNCDPFPYQTSDSHGWYYEASVFTCDETE